MMLLFVNSEFANNFFANFFVGNSFRHINHFLADVYTALTLSEENRKGLTHVFYKVLIFYVEA